MSKHGATICTTGRHGCWAHCLCGWKSPLYTTAGGASIAFAEHMREATR